MMDSASATCHRTKYHSSHHFAFASASPLLLQPPSETVESAVASLDALKFKDALDGTVSLLSSLPATLQLPALPLTEKNSKESGQKEHRSGPKPPWLNKTASRGKNANSLQKVAVPDDTVGLCVEVTHGRKRVYHERNDAALEWEGWDMVESITDMKARLVNLFKSYFLPSGYPESVAPQYASYMGWRGVQYFFGGAISVYTTRSLLGALGVAGKYSGEAAAAINWVIKDGAGRLGRLLFARWGRELDCELKQFRLAGDLLMEGGALLELATAWAPQAFLPLACTANLAKNLAAVAASSTRAPIYRTFALQNNMADITAKGESVANCADIAGTVAGIMLTKISGLPVVPTFLMLSAGYLLASRMEVDSVELPYLNRARLAYVAQDYLSNGRIAGIAEANHNEALLPWAGFNGGRIFLGSEVEAACQGPSDLKTSISLSRSTDKYILCYRPDQKKAHVLLKDGANGQDCLKAMFAAHLFLYCLDGHDLNSQLTTTAAATSTSKAAVSTATIAEPVTKTMGRDSDSSSDVATARCDQHPLALSAVSMNVASVAGSESAFGTCQAATESESAVVHTDTSGDHTTNTSSSLRRRRHWFSRLSNTAVGPQTTTAGGSVGVSEHQGRLPLRETHTPASSSDSAGAGVPSATAMCCQQQASLQSSSGVYTAGTSSHSATASRSSEAAESTPLTTGSVDESQAMWQGVLGRTSDMMDTLYPQFMQSLEKEGWKLHLTMLNPKETRLLKAGVPLESTMRQ